MNEIGEKLKLSDENKEILVKLNETCRPAVQTTENFEFYSHEGGENSNKNLGNEGVKDDKNNNQV